MKIILASGNKGKIKEIKNNLPFYQIIPYFDLIDHIDIDEDKDTFEENAIKKAMCIYENISHLMEKNDFYYTSALVVLCSVILIYLFSIVWWKRKNSTNV